MTWRMDVLRFTQKSTLRIIFHSRGKQRRKEKNSDDHKEKCALCDVKIIQSCINCRLPFWKRVIEAKPYIHKIVPRGVGVIFLKHITLWNLSKLCQ